MKTVLKTGVSQFKISNTGLRIALVLMSTKPYVMLKLNTEDSLEAILRKIDTLRYIGGSRNLAAGLHVVNHVVFQPENGDRPDADNFVILITCGPSTAKPRSTALYARKVKYKGVKIFAVGITKFDMGEINTIASPPLKKTVFQVNNDNELVGAFFKILEEIRLSSASQLPSSETTLSTLNSFISYLFLRLINIVRAYCTLFTFVILSIMPVVP